MSNVARFVIGAHNDPGYVFGPFTTENTDAGPGPSFTGANLYAGLIGGGDVIVGHLAFFRRALSAEALAAIAACADVYTADPEPLILAENPEVYWKLQEASGTTLADSSGNGHDGFLIGGTLGNLGSLISGQNCCDFGESGGQYAVSNDSFDLGPNEPFTLLALLYSFPPATQSGTVFGFAPPFGHPEMDARLVIGPDAGASWNDGGAQSIGLEDMNDLGVMVAFVFETPIPTVTSVTPSTVTTAGGTSVVLGGTTLSGATSVKFGGVDAASFTVDGDTQVTAVTPAHAAGTVAVVVA
jgi:hypothetical protein